MNKQHDDEKCPSTAIDVNIDEQIAYTLHIIETHFNTLSWLDVKAQSLLAIAAASFTAATFAIKNLNGLGVYGNSAIIVALVVLIIGMAIALNHSIPILNAGIGNSDNPRVVIGIAKMGKDEYHNTIKNLCKNDMLQHNCHQISGLAQIIVSGKARVDKSVKCIGLGLIIIAITVAIWGFKILETNQSAKNIQQIETITTQDQRK